MRQRSVEARDLAAEARRDLTQWWNSTRTTLWGPGIPGAADAPRLFIFRPGHVVERSTDAAMPSGWVELLPDAAQSPLTGRVVLLVHGLDESTFIWDDLAPALVAAGLTPVSFDYANDQPIARTADQLADSLRRLRAAGVESIAIVGHSMGALAARDVLTRPAFAAGGDLPRITRLVMLAAPNHGSPLTALLPLSEAREHLARRIDGHADPDAGGGWIHSARDGNGEAAADLATGSAFLTELNARPLPEALPITNIVSRMVSSGDRDRVRATLARNLNDLLDPDAARAVTGFVDDAIDGLVDGVVSADSMVLDGIADTVEVRANHRSMIRTMRLGALQSASIPPAVAIIVNRLAGDAAPE